MMRRPELPPELVEAASALVHRKAGLVFSAPRQPAFRAGLLTAMRRAGTADPAAYLRRLGDEPDLFDDLVSEITVGETYFFRDTDQFALLRDFILPSVLSDRSPPRPPRIWSAGCATGEECFSLAILLRQLGRVEDARILGTDVSRPALRKARRARYSRWSLRGVSPEVVHSFFRADGQDFLLLPAVQRMVEFRYLNLAEDVYPSPALGIWGMDLILCRNVFIYFATETVARVAEGLLASLNDHGWLLLGASDPLLRDYVHCEVEVTAAGLAYRRATPRRLPARVELGKPAFAMGTSGAPPLEPVPAPHSLVGSSVRPAVEPPATEAASTLAAARERYAARDYARTVELAREELRRHPNDAGTWILLVRALANQGELAASERACLAALERHPTSAELMSLHAVLLAEAGRHQDAIGAARRAVYLDRELAVAHLALGGSLTRLRQNTAARRAFRNAERLLAALPPDQPVAAADGELAGRLLEMARVQLMLQDDRRG
jgi:chemotaxis protein methyltransferase CheR